jgi:hypothetical protein
MRHFTNTTRLIIVGILINTQCGLGLNSKFHIFTHLKYLSLTTKLLDKNKIILKRMRWNKCHHFPLYYI